MEMNIERENVMMAAEILRRNGEGRHLSWRQKKVRPRIENVMCHLLDGAALKDALTFVEKIRTNGMKIKWTSVNTWRVTFKRKHVCDIIIDKGSWSVNYVSEYICSRESYIPYSPSRMRCKLEALKNVVLGTQPAYQASY